MLAIKITFVLEINIDGSSSTEGTNNLKTFFRILPIKLTFLFKISWLAGYFAVQGNLERKREKTFACQWRKKEIAKKKKDWKKMERKWGQVEVMWEVKAGRLLADHILKSHEL